MKYFLLFTLCIFFSLNATAICPKQKIEVVFKKKHGKIIYNNELHHSEFQNVANYVLPNNVRGLTVSKITVTSAVEGRGFKHLNSQCVGISKINFYIGFDDFRVYINKPYRPGSCEYYAVKDHEDEHVDIYKEGLEFFAPDIKKALRDAVKNLRPEQVYSKARAQQVFDKQVKEVSKKIQPLLDHINAKLHEKQRAIDTDESYRRVTRKCRNW